MKYTKKRKELLGSSWAFEASIQGHMKRNSPGGGEKGMVLTQKGRANLSPSVGRSSPDMNFLRHDFLGATDDRR